MDNLAAFIATTPSGLLLLFLQDVKHRNDIPINASVLFITRGRLSLNAQNTYFANSVYQKNKAILM